MPDIHGNRGIDLFDKHGVQFVHGDEPADFGIAKDGALVQGVDPKKSLLLIFEPPSQLPKTYKPEVRSKFMNTLSTIEIPAGTPQYVIPRSLNTVGEFFDRPKENFLCIIGTDWKSKRGFRKQDLGKKRLALIRYFTRKLGPERFSVYGRWPKPGKCYKGAPEPFAHGLAGYNLTSPVTKDQTPCWDAKFGILASHRFTLALENSSWPGYCGCKALEAQCCGSIPLYEGPPDVDKFMPPGTYIDMRGRSKRELYKTIVNMSDEEESAYRERIREYVHGMGSDVFSSVTFAKKLLTAMGIIDER